MSLLEGVGGRWGWGHGIVFFLFSCPQGLRESEKKNVALFWEGKRGGQPFASFFFFFLFLFPFFFLFSVFLRNETKRSEMKLCGSYSSFMNDLEMSPKKEFRIIFI